MEILLLILIIAGFVFLIAGPRVSRSSRRPRRYSGRTTTSTLAAALVVTMAAPVVTVAVALGVTLVAALAVMAAAEVQVAVTNEAKSGVVVALVENSGYLPKENEIQK